MQKYGITHLDEFNGSKGTMVVYTPQLNDACAAQRSDPRDRYLGIYIGPCA